jgi:hypothetical protein
VTTTTAGAVPAGYKRVGDATQGISVAVPNAWVEINPAKQTMANAAKQLNLPGVSASTLVQEAESLEKMHAIIAIDAASATTSPDHFTRNINAYCVTSGINDTGSAGVPFLQQAAKAQFSTIASHVTQQNAEIGGVPGVETSYQISTKTGTKIGAAQLEVLPKPDKACFVTLTYGSPRDEGNYLSVAAATAQFP